MTRSEEVYWFLLNEVENGDVSFEEDDTAGPYEGHIDIDGHTFKVTIEEVMT